MKIKKLYTYPIKSLRETNLPEAILTSKGFQYDRRFLLLKVVNDNNNNNNNSHGEYELRHMNVSRFPEMALFKTDIVFPDRVGGEDQDGKIIVAYSNDNNSDNNEVDGEGEGKALEIPLQPNVHELNLNELDVNLHGSPTKAYDMGAVYNNWFSECFGYRVVLAYLGSHSRGVLGSFAPSRKKRNWNWNWKLVQPYEFFLGIPVLAVLLWTVSIQRATGISLHFLVVEIMVRGCLFLWNHITTTTTTTDEERQQLTFADCAPYLIISSTSLDNVSSRLPSDQPMDITKFRPNIVISGAETPFEEDFWTELAISPPPSPSSNPPKKKGRLLLTANCVRCTSINVDYATGKMGTGESGNVLKKLMKDRRVDTGARYSPVFGRYGFLELESGGEDKGLGQVVRVGDEVVVANRAQMRTVFDWPGLGN